MSDGRKIPTKKTPNADSFHAVPYVASVPVMSTLLSTETEISLETF